MGRPRKNLLPEQVGIEEVKPDPHTLETTIYLLPEIEFRNDKPIKITNINVSKNQPRNAGKTCIKLCIKIPTKVLKPSEATLTLTDETVNAIIEEIKDKAYKAEVKELSNTINEIIGD